MDLSNAAYHQLRTMRGQIEIGAALKPGGPSFARIFKQRLIIVSYVQGSRVRYEFTPWGWLFANREALWNYREGRGDVHSLARHWKRHSQHEGPESP